MNDSELRLKFFSILKSTRATARCIIRSNRHKGFPSFPILRRIFPANPKGPKELSEPINWRRRFGRPIPWTPRIDNTTKLDFAGRKNEIKTCMRSSAIPIAIYHLRHSSHEGPLTDSIPVRDLVLPATANSMAPVLPHNDIPCLKKSLLLFQFINPCAYLRTKKNCDEVE